MPRFAVIFPAAGSSQRFAPSSDFRLKKPFVDLKGRPVWLRAVEAFMGREDVCQCLLVLAAEDIAEFKERNRAHLAFMNLEIVTGGAARSDSVANALEKVTAEAEFVAVHDAARPVMAKSWIDAVFAAAVTHGAAIPAIPITSTIKRTDSSLVIRETVPREHLWAAQTPQVFEKGLLREAYARRQGLQATDEAQLVEQLGRPVTIVPGSPLNLKITTQDDLRLAGTFLGLLPNEKSLNFLHPFSDEKL